MSGWGILAAGIGGGAQATGNITAGMIDQERRLQSAQALSDIDEQKWARIDEARQRRARDDQTYNATGPGADELDAVAKRKAGIELDAKVAEATNPLLRQAKVDDATAAATATHKLQKQFTIEDASDPAYLKAEWARAMADPRVKAAYTASMASAGSSAAHAKVLGAQYDQLVEVGNRATELRNLQTKLSKSTSQADRDAIQQQIGDLSSGGKDPSKFLSLAEKAQDNVAGALKVLSDPMATDEAKDAARSQMRRATELSNKAAALGGIKMDAAPSSYPMPTQGHIDALKKDPSRAAEFDVKFGPGAAAAAGVGGKAENPAAPTKPAGILPVVTPQGQPNTGVEGLSDIALRAIANDPANPRRQAALAALEERKQATAEAMRQRMADPATDPAMYQ